MDPPGGSSGTRDIDTGAVVKILVVVDGTLSILDCGRLSRRGALSSERRATTETLIPRPGASGSVSSPYDGGTEDHRWDAHRERYQDEGGEG